MPVRFAIPCLIALTSISFAADPGSAEFFENKVRPVLVEHCNKCHGDAKGKEPKGGLRTDSRAAMLRGGDNGPAIVPKDPDKSRLIEAIRFENADLQMPPKGKLPPAAIADLTAWVKAGAYWPNDTGVADAGPTGIDVAKRKREHWAWSPIAVPAIPATKNAAWPRSDVDRYVLAKLEAKGLAPAAPADRRTWIRRVTFDLTGLPPSVAELDAYLADMSPEAESKVVDRLLASIQYAERWARHWLDLVRYGETRGHEFDPIIPNAYQYRDYVIRALAADVPYNQFVREHLAGDLLPSPRRATNGGNESILGTGFWFLGEEVHSPVDIRQDQADRFDNRIDVFAKTFLGLTVACARCHDHKFDAITTKDYYALFGIVQSSGYRLVRFDSMLQNREVAEKLAKFDRELAPSLARELANLKPSQDLARYLLAAGEMIRLNNADANALAKRDALDANNLRAWVEMLKSAAREPASPWHAFARLSSDAANQDARKFSASLAALRAKAIPPANKLSVVVDYSQANPADWNLDEGSFGTGPVKAGDVRPDANNRPRFVDVPAAEFDRAFANLTTAPGSENDTGRIGKHVRAGRTVRSPNFRVAGKVHYLVRGSGQAYAAVAGHTLLHGPLHGGLVIDFPASSGYRWVTHQLSEYNGQPAHIELTATSNDFAVAMIVQGEAPPPLPTNDVPTARDLTDLANQIEQGLQAMVARWTTSAPASAIEARTANTLLAIPSVATAMDRFIATSSESRAAIAKGIVQQSRLALATWDANGLDEQVFVRGSPKGLGDRVPRRFLEALTGNATLSAPGSGRMELAQIVTDPAKTPFVTRVMVNRVWHHLFGRGLVGSVDNLGVLGETPTHPELLDFLADRFAREGWSIKRLIRDLVLSKTYGMSTRSDDATETADPQDLLLHRMRVRRIDGESIRDSLLMLSGRLDRTSFGPSTPIHLTPFLDGRGRPASGPLDGNGRRSIYLGVRRNFLSPLLLAFDTPIPFSTVGRRQVSNVPAQALILLNDPFVQQQASLWSKAILARPGTTDDRINAMYVAAFSRPPSNDELSACREFLKEQGTRYGKPDDPRAWADLTHTLINMKEMIYLN